ncbi:venom allergen 5 [Eurytemora carolleeae]|uniref:venom allergen 5 n=1 Tax=Eurytemora carolleeae TaxID=1294199 RepID=UPI000C75E8E0|nr:venom allergen 5 [Eurytemora carolleeae]XP_023334483.1 venom allergen 5 [Eurytemora carolleeae]XP_023334484.1 venom allergen 5 [Eurytemora carolleeae]|eukprot:XP_023334482.1 venom allergen 5-like [Eurytemora affinis]
MCAYAPLMCTGRKMLRSGGLNCLEKEIILEEHNMVRQLLANGKVHSQPAALNMRVMIWDDELAQVAQRWADQCMPGHDHSRNVDRYAVGQNVATTWNFDQESLTKDSPEFKRHIRAWFDEVVKFGFKTRSINPFQFRMETGHYTQLAWAESYMVGCGYSYYKDTKRGFSKLYVCNYGPGGNLVGKPMYKVGFPGMVSCSEEDSENMKPSSRYVGLCEVNGARYVEHMCQDIKAPSLVETPPFLHLPTPRPEQSIFQEMMGNNAISDLAMTSSNFLMNGVKTTMHFADMGVKTTMHFADMGVKTTMHFADMGVKTTIDLANLLNPLLWG